MGDFLHGPKLAAIGVNRLSVFAQNGGVAAIERAIHSVAKNGMGDLDGELVHQNVSEQVRRERRRVLLDVAAVPVERGIRAVLQKLNIGEHALLHDFNVIEADHVFDDDKSVGIDGRNSLGKVLGSEALADSFFIGELNALHVPILTASRRECLYIVEAGIRDATNTHGRRSSEVDQRGK